MTRDVLIVGESDPLKAAYARLLTDAGIGSEAVPTSRDAVAHVIAKRPSVMLLELRLPDGDGLDLIPEVLAHHPALAIVALAEAPDVSLAMSCVRVGAVDCLGKPVDSEDLVRSVERAARISASGGTVPGQSLWYASIDPEVEVPSPTTIEEGIAVSTLNALVFALEAKNVHLAGHSMRVAALSATIASGLGLDDDEVEGVRIGGRLHDLGMIGVREEVLNKRGKLTDDEYRHIKDHATLGAKILEPLTHLGPIVDYVRTHHERWDGRGYPDGLRGEEIPIGGRIIHAAEIYDALTTSRPYKETMSSDEAVEVMVGLKGSVLDPDLIETLCEATRARKTLEFVPIDLPPLEE